MATEHAIKLFQGLVEIAFVDGELLSRLSLEHKQSGGTNIVNPGIALANIIRSQPANTKKIKSLLNTCNLNKIYDTSVTPPIVRNEIEILAIDKTLQHDLLFNLEGFPISKPTHKNNIIRCSISIGNCGGSCTRKQYCCDRCRACKQCNESLAPNLQCPVFKLRNALNKDKLLRNLFSHITTPELEKFINRKHVFKDFPNVKTWQELSEEFVDVMENLCDYMTNQNNFSKSNSSMTPKEKKEKLEKLKQILNLNNKALCDMNLLMNLRKAFLEHSKTLVNDVTDKLATTEMAIIKEIKAMKENNQAEKVLLLPIDVEKVESQRCINCCPVYTPLFWAKDVSHDGMLIKIFLENTEKSFKELYNATVANKDYRIVTTRLKCTASPNLFTNSFEFKITIADYNKVLPENLSSSLTKESSQLAFKLESNFEKALKEKCKPKITVKVHEISIGSFIILGTISRKLFKFSKETQNELSKIMVRETKKVFGSVLVTVETTPAMRSTFYGSSHKIIVAISNQELAAKLEKDGTELENMIMERVHLYPDFYMPPKKPSRFQKDARFPYEAIPLIGGRPRNSYETIDEDVTRQMGVCFNCNKKSSSVESFHRKCNVSSVHGNLSTRSYEQYEGSSSNVGTAAAVGVASAVAATVATATLPFLSIIGPLIGGAVASNLVTTAAKKTRIVKVKCDSCNREETPDDFDKVAGCRSTCLSCGVPASDKSKFCVRLCVQCKNECADDIW